MDELPYEATIRIVAFMVGSKERGKVNYAYEFRA